MSYKLEPGLTKNTCSLQRSCASLHTKLLGGAKTAFGVVVVTRTATLPFQTGTPSSRGLNKCPISTVVVRSSNGDDRSLNRESASLNMEDKIEIVADMLEAWNSTVESYSTKCMTKEEDRLPALSGIAKRFQNIIGGQYLAGIWERHLILGLCWYVGSPGKRPEKYIAPSWSWASVLNVEMYPERMDIKDAEETKI